METQLLRTKLYIPLPRPGLVPRQRLKEQLDAGLWRDGGAARKLTLVSAPAGFGKTTVVGAWVDALGDVSPPIAVGWLSLDESDNDLIRFLTYLVAALQTVNPSICKGTLLALRSPQVPPVEAVLTMLINDIAALPERIVLVLDDYHLIGAQPIHDALAFLLRRLPPQLHLVIATREDPLLPLSRLRARGQMTELRAADLRFMSEETAEFLNRVMGLDLSAEDTAALEARTEGWIAGLQLTALALQGSIRERGHGDVSRFIESSAGSHRLVLDYLIEDVLEQQSEEVQAFLVQTAVLDRLTGSLCDAVRFDMAGTPGSSEGTAPTGRGSGQAILERLEHANLFVTPLDAERRWYRYHHLFADLLLRRLRQTDAAQLPALHLRASAWFRGEGMNREAIKHSLAARDYRGAAELIKASAIDIMQQGEHTAVVGWINTLPEDLVRGQPYLCVLHAWALQLTGQLEAAEARLDDAQSALDSRGDASTEDVDTVLGLVHSHHAYVSFMRGEHRQTIAYAQQALDRLPAEAALIRTQTALYQGVAYRYQGQLDAALEVYRDVLPVAQGLGGRSVAALCYNHLGDLEMQFAHLHQAKAWYEDAISVTERHSGRTDLPFLGYIYVSIGRVLRQWNQLEDAYRLTSQGVALCRHWRVADILALSCVELAYIHQALGQDHEARESMGEALQIMRDFSPWGIDYVSAYQADLAVKQGDVAAAERWAQAGGLDIDGDYQFHREVEYLTLVRVLLAQGRLDEAHALARRILRTARETGAKQTELEVLVLLALILRAAGRTDPSRAHLVRALSIGEAEGYVRLFVDEGPPMARLLYRALERGITPDYVRRLLAAFPVVEPASPKAPEGQRRSLDLLEPLSDRELEVLQSVAEGLTNREIASKLFLSPHTVKAHTRSIYGKLNVHNRTQAVARAQALGLLPTA